MDKPKYLIVCEASRSGKSREEIAKELGMTRKQVKDLLYKAKKKGLVCEPEKEKKPVETEGGAKEVIKKIEIDPDELLAFVVGDKAELIRKINDVATKTAVLAYKAREVRASVTSGACVVDIDLHLGRFAVHVRHDKCRAGGESVSVAWKSDGRIIMPSDMVRYAKKIIMALRSYISDDLKTAVIDAGIKGDRAVVDEYISLVKEFNGLVDMYNNIFSK